MPRILQINLHNNKVQFTCIDRKKVYIKQYLLYELDKKKIRQKCYKTIIKLIKKTWNFGSRTIQL